MPRHVRIAPDGASLVTGGWAALTGVPPDPGPWASWSDVDEGTGKRPTITIDGSIYPDSAGVQFLINGVVDDRDPNNRPNGYDATGPNEGSTYHVYPDITLAADDVVEGRWVTEGSGTFFVSTYTVTAGAGGGGNEPNPDPPPPPTSPPDQPAQRPDATTTGPRFATTSTQGSTTISSSQLIERVRFTGQVTVTADNVTFRDCIFDGGKYGIYNNVFTGNASTGLVVEHCEFTNHTSACLAVKNADVRWCEMHELTSDAIKTWGNTYVYTSYFHHMGLGEGAHADAVQIRGGVDFRFQYNNMDIAAPAPYRHNACFMLQSSEGPVANLVIDSNWLNGGNYTIFSHGVTNWTYTNNRFGRGYAYGLITSSNGAYLDATNVWDDNGLPV